MSTTRQAVTRLTLDMRIPDSQRSVTVTEGDVNRRWEITLIDGGRPFPVPLTWRVALAGVKSDATVLYEGCVIDGGGRIIYDFASGPQIATCVGAFPVRLDLWDEAGRLVASPSVWVNVMPGQRAVIGRAIASSDSFGYLSTIKEEHNELKGDLEKIRREISSLPVLPEVTDAQNGYFLRVVDGKWTPVTMGELPFYYIVRFYNDDKTTVLYEVTVPMGGDAIYAGGAPVSALKADSVFSGFEPSPTNVTSDMDCYAMYEYVELLNHLPWSKISAMSAEGTAENYFAVGDTKTIHVEGTVGTLDVNDDYKAFIIGFDHNKEMEGEGITFGTFKNAAGRDMCLVDSKYSDWGTKGNYFSMNHWTGYNYGGWAGCELRYDVLGSTDVMPLGYGADSSVHREGRNPSEVCATEPVANTLMSALPSDLRAVMRRMRIFTDNKGGANNNASNVTESYDYLPLLAQYEVFGTTTNSNSAEQCHQAQYSYYKYGGSKAKISQKGAAVSWWLRSVYIEQTNVFKNVDYAGGLSRGTLTASLGLAPIFRV